MGHIDIFNGDADGICALTQIRNATPADSRLVTGVKRDISLVAKAGIEAGDQVTVLDISLVKNRDAIVEALALGVDIFYADHHDAGEIPDDSRLTALIDTAPNVCTSLLVNRHLQGQFSEWAVVGAFGDNLKAPARALAEPLRLSEGQLDLLDRLGVCINYNGYGASLEDLHFEPEVLFRLVSRYASPFDFVEDSRDPFTRLEDGYREDMSKARELRPQTQTNDTAVLLFPDESWARRSSGVFSNELANGSPARAHAVITERADGTYLVSVRAPLERKTGASELCRRFPTGGGREAAAGINNLPADQLDAFISEFTTFYGR
jgi:hypothetical protein